jgi:hypothetical protein
MLAAARILIDPANRATGRGERLQDQQGIRACQVKTRPAR